MDLKQREILIIDDDITNIQILQKILEKEGYLTKSTSKPEEAIKYIKSDYPDLVLMDIGLEGTNGFELTSAIKSDPNNAYLPIIFITGQRDKDYILKAYKTGAVDYIVKPIEKETLLARIETHLKISSLYRELLSKNEEIAAINEEYSAVNEEYFAINEELTETNQKLQKLYNEAENREELLKTTMNSISWGIISSDLNGIVTNVNQFALKFLNIEPDDIIGKPFNFLLKIFHSETKKSLSNFFEDAINLKSPVYFPDGTKIKVNENNKFFIDGSISPIKNSKYEITGYVISFNDITEKTVQRKKIEEIKERLSLVIDASQEGIWDWDVIENKVYFSPQWKAQIGFEEHELENKFDVWVEHLHPEEREEKLKTLNDFIESPQKYFFLTFRFRHKNGSYRIIQNKAITVKDANGKLIRFVGAHTDITEQVEAATKIREAQKKWEAIFNGLSHPTMILDAQHNIIEVNDALCQKAQKTPEEIKKLKCWQIFHPADQQQPHEKCPLEKIYTTKATSSAEMEMLAFGGHYLVSCTPLLDDQGNIKSIIHIATDISELKKTRQELSDSENKFRNAFYTSSDSIVISKLSNAQLVFINKGFSEITGISQEQAQGQSIKSLNLWVDLKKREELVEIIKSKGAVLDFEAEFFDKDGNIRIGLVSGSVFDFKGEKHVVYIVRDITERKKQELLIKSALERAEESEKLKSAFLANMSHEIRTPMNGILGFVELLKTPGLTEEDRTRYLHIIENSGYRMLNLINDLIDISKAEAGIIKPKYGECNINRILDENFQFFLPQAKNKNLQLNYYKSLTNEKARIISDSELLNRILSNIIKNAIKYTDEGEVSFWYEVKDKYVEFHVKDTGQGIPQEKISSIFDRFVQADPENIKAKEGAGLGLAIAKAYTEILGGKISVNSDENGTVFYFSIPFIPVVQSIQISKNQKIEISNKIKEKLNILIAEDDSISELYLKLIVKPISRKIQTCNNGRDAVEIVKKNPDIDLILMDIRMPELNGYEAVKEIRKFNKEVKIIAQTAFGYDKDRKKCLDAGCDSYISKPLNKNELLKLIEEIFI